MKDQIISYREMCDQENIQTLQRGMNYRLNPKYSVILMSLRRNAPYKDKVYSDGFTIEYEGHDRAKSQDVVDPKAFDQPRFTQNGNPTQNGFFALAVDEFKLGKRQPEVVRVYEKIMAGVWSEKGFFRLVDYQYQLFESHRKVFRFILEEVVFDCEKGNVTENALKSRSRIIPSQIKKEVWVRDGGKCVICGAKDELHFDHDLPYSKGGSSISIENVNILCARHNLSKSNKIE